VIIETWIRQFCYSYITILCSVVDIRDFNKASSGALYLCFTLYPSIIFSSINILMVLFCPYGPSFLNSRLIKMLWCNLLSRHCWRRGRTVVIHVAIAPYIWSLRYVSKSIRDNLHHIISVIDIFYDSLILYACRQVKHEFLSLFSLKLWIRLISRIVLNLDA
jgi:hypothetical protein